ncbi:hypothetical protein A9513_020450 [Pseudomonas sp. AU12215]|nr:hypothetical protein A9513_020450 [Pseudomonas sp. AU12215]
MLGSLAGILWQPGELAAPDFTQVFAPIDAAQAQRTVDLTTWQTPLRQLLANPHRTVTCSRTAGDVAFQVTAFIEQPLLGQTVEGGVDQVLCGAALPQLARELCPAMLASCQQVHGDPSHRDEVIELAGHRDQ